jgi:Tol biopolymer transport system component
MVRAGTTLVLLLISLAVVACGAGKAGESLHTSLYTVQIDGGELGLLRSDPELAHWGAAWSPDGSRLAFTLSTPGGDQGDLYLANAGGTALTQLTNNGRTNYLPAWAPDGQTISFISQEGDDTATAEVYAIRVDGGDEVRLTDNDAWEYGTSWSPDGSTIVFGSERGGEWQIYTMDADGGNQVPLPHPAHGNAPVWSPDGAQIAFTSDRDGDDDIYVMDADGSNQRNLTRNEDWDQSPAWSPDGSQIAFTSGRDGIHGICVMDAGGGAAVSVVSGGGLEPGIARWSADGSRLVFHGAQVEE